MDERGFVQKFEDRRAFILGDSGIHAATSIFDPHVNGRGLSPEELLEGCNFISELASYRSKEDIFGKGFVWEEITQAGDSLQVLLKKRAVMPSKTWWSAFFTDSGLARVARGSANPEHRRFIGCF